MAVFTYSALNKAGVLSNGDITANDRADAFRRLDRNGLQPVSLKPKEEGGVSVAAKEAKPAAAKEKAKPETIKAVATVAPKPAGAKTGEPEKTKATIPQGPVKLKRGDIILFTEELSDLLAAGLQLEPALRIMESRDELSGVKDVTTILRSRIRDGASFSQSLKVASPKFGELYFNLF